MDAGHFVQRDRKATRFNEQNVHTQCTCCNRYRSGEQFLHSQAIDRLYGQGAAELLKNISMARGSKINAWWLEIKIEEYKKKVKELKKKLDLPI
jgi:hypothetical protein